MQVLANIMTSIWTQVTEAEMQYENLAAPDAPSVNCRVLKFHIDVHYCRDIPSQNAC